MGIIFNIKKLGAIRDSKVEFKPFMIFSGNSSMGKSYTAFLVYYLTSLCTNKRLKVFVNGKYDSNELFNELEKEKKLNVIVSIRDLQRWINFSSKNFVGYLLGNNEFEADVNIEFDMDDIKMEFSLEKSETVDNLNLSPDELIMIRCGNEAYSMRGFDNKSVPNAIAILIGYRMLSGLFGKEQNFHTVFLPPSRASLVGSTFSMIKEITSSAGMYKEFLNDMEVLISAREETFHPSKNITRAIEDLLGGSIKNEKGALFYEFNESRIPITSAASSIKELTPLFLLLNRFHPRNFSVLFEEPEAHTHPELQVKIADLISKLVNEGAFFQVTTHSDYFLNQINNLIRLFKMKSVDNAKFEEFCEKNNINKNNILDPKLLGAYYFKKREDNSVEIVTQDVFDGVPFDTFENTVDSLMRTSSEIDDFQGFIISHKPTSSDKTMITKKARNKACYAEKLCEKFIVRGGVTIRKELSLLNSFKLNDSFVFTEMPVHYIAAEEEEVDVLKYCG